MIATHFFLDCFNETELEKLVTRVSGAARLHDVERSSDTAQPGALWLISEFRQPGWSGPLLRAMYLFFRATTGLENERLVDHRPVLERRGFRLLREETSRRGWLASELWMKAS